MIELLHLNLCTLGCLMQNNEELKRALKNRHIQLIAFGGAIGTGLFLGTGSAVFSAGPSVILGYFLVGFLAFMIMRQLGEMLVEEPAAGSFSYFAYKYWGVFPGFLAGWNYWILYVMVSISELTAVAAYMQFWWPWMPTWVSTFIFFIIINAINFLTVRAFGEIEFWFSIVKIVAIVAMILFGIYILVFATDLVPEATIKNLWQAPINNPNGPSGFMPNGIMGLIVALPVIMFAFGGLELVGIAAAETSKPKEVIPRATNQIMVRILIFYIGTLVVLLSLHHWSNLTRDSSPFTMIFTDIGFKNVAGILNFVILIAALSVFNSGIYSTSRMLYGLSRQGNAPKIFSKVNTRGVPVVAMSLAGVLIFAVVPLNYFLPEWQDAFREAMSFVVVALIINWAMISLAHIFFKRAVKDTSFKALFYPIGNYICLVFILFTIIAMTTFLGMHRAVIALPIWIAFIYLIFALFRDVWAREAKN